MSTRRPWKFVPQTKHPWLLNVFEPTGPGPHDFEAVCTVDGRPPNEARAHLITAAPDLLAALEEIEDTWDGKSPTALMPAPERHSAIRAMHARARAAIARAKGK